MTRLALTIHRGHCIYEINIGSSIAPKIIFERKVFGPDSIDYVSHDVIFYCWSNGLKDIYKTHSNNPKADEDLPIYQHPTYIRDIKIRDDAVKYKFFFSAYHSETEGRIFFLDEQDNAVPYYTLAGSDLKVPDICNPGCYTYWSTWRGGHFAFDDKNNLYFTTGNTVPSGLFKISGAGPETVTGNVQRIYESVNFPISAIEFLKPNFLLYSSGTKLFKLDLDTLESTLQYDTSDLSDKPIQNISLMEGGFKKKFNIKKAPSIFLKKKLKLQHAPK